MAVAAMHTPPAEGEGDAAGEAAAPGGGQQREARSLILRTIPSIATWRQRLRA